LTAPYREATVTHVHDRRQALRDASGGHPNDQRYVSFILRGRDLDPDEITDSTGLTPSRAFRLGDPKPRTGIPHERGAWILESGLGESDEFHDHLDALLARMRPAWPTFVALGHRYDAELSVGVFMRRAQGPLVEVVPDVVAAIAELNAAIWLDLYAFPGDEPDDDSEFTTP
jgi:hypothetical protein